MEARNAIKLVSKLLAAALVVSTQIFPGTVAKAQGVQELMPQAEEAYREGRLEEAEALLKKAIELNPQDAAAYNSLGTTLYYQKRYEEAIRSYEKAIELNPEAVSYTHLRAHET